MDEKLFKVIFLVAAFSLTMLTGAYNQNRLIKYEARNYGTVSRLTLNLGNAGAFTTAFFAVVAALLI
ncbi:hypothetical protein C4561_03790 [candidate division WWE3 bacterium]|jgi:hypothetical protein|uniref:Uncharacterized protein n=1 Tax=candidate division WWE3 bacterium TaxID=2053526 RepID=A0A3A4ZJM9_UNCKA|nr:MAG: hypothetical protein C4561_03790 [candidate division WWE3 bacterium]